ncbi:hypothetical protein [Nonomuraea sp. NPDC023979]|uniref:hypothetical protein n=1 Tax=Nonomuraea sp. NPDC023979 TaxID=3154796 RepID=UPI0033C0DE94
MAARDIRALEAIHQRLLADDDWNADTLQAIEQIILDTGRVTIAENVRADMIEDHRGRPVARVDSDQMVGFFYQAAHGGIRVELFTRDAEAAGRLHVELDGQPLHASGARDPGSGARPAPCDVIHSTT